MQHVDDRSDASAALQAAAASGINLTGLDTADRVGGLL
jgi:hypothetical protein